MSWMLYRIGHFSFRKRWLVLGVWIALLVTLCVGAATLAGKTSDEFTLDGLESTDAFALIKERTPDANPDGASARVVFQAPPGDRLDDYRAEIAADLDLLDTKHVTSIASPFDTAAISEDGRTGYATIQYDVQSPELPDGVRDGFADIGSNGSSSTLKVAVGGDANEAQVEPGAEEGLGILVALVVLAITLGTLRAAGMSLLTAVIGVGIGLTGITTASGFIELGSTTTALATMLGLAVGIDYALFIVTRYRQELRDGRTPEEAAGVAVGTAGSAVVFAGATVIIALCGLATVGIPFLTEMGLGAAATVAIAVLIAITLLPALCGFAGERVLVSRVPWLRRRGERLDAQGERTMGRRWVEAVVRRPWPWLIGGLLAATVVAIPAASLELALPDQGTAPKQSQARVAYDLISDNFGAGANGPLIAVVDTKDAQDPNAAITAANAALQRVGDDARAVIPAGPTSTDAKAAAAFEQQLEQVQFAIATIIPKTGPSDADTADVVRELRDAVRDVERTTGARVLISGQTAVGVDVSASLADSFPRYLLVVVGLALVLLACIFRSILVPLKAVLGFLVSVMFAVGSLVAVAQWGWGAELIGIDTPGPILSFLPVLLTGILFGLAMDYELFLVSRMHEERAHGAAHREAIVTGFAHGARVVVAAALIMISVFASFALAPDPIIKTIGFSLAMGILADAFLVRMLLVPAAMAIVGDQIWWMPRWLDAILPNFDLEGHGLKQRLLERERLAAVTSSDASSREPSPTRM